MTNIAELLKDAPKGMKLYSPLFGEVKFKYINDSKFGIVVEDSEECCRSFDKYGRYFTAYNNAECLLFPSKDCRTWEEWKLPVKPKFKFKVGDWIAYNENKSSITPMQIIKITENKYIVSGHWSYDFRTLEADWHLWNINDAQNGDVLISKSGNPFIFLEDRVYAGYHNIIAYCGINTMGNFTESRRKECWTYGTSLKPATKEQRDLLFTKMKEAGYTWDSEKKELKKIQSHYDIANFHAGMPVLVRETSLNAWQYVLFSHCYMGGDGLTRFNAGLVGFTQCIPFNEETKHLLGTTDMPSEEYINW